MRRRDWVLLVCFVLVLASAIATVAIVLAETSGPCTPNYNCVRRAR
jgi:hypothetical protein